ncbi:MAG: ABC transporter permease [Bacteroidales bacterium]|nr:ABC transporter permease [Bacteroidales bacterium]
MFKTLFKTIWSHISQNKAYAAINIGGLAIGIGCSLVIYKIIAYETSFDSYHKNYENVYRLITDYKDAVGEIKYEEGQVPPVGEAIRNEFPGIDAVMTFYAAKGQIDQVSIENENGEIQKYQENKGIVCADPNIFKVFDFNFLAGNSSEALINKGSVVISSSLAQKYFGLSAQEVGEAMNRLITVNNKLTLQVSGVISDPPKNTDLPFTMIANYYDQIIINPYFGGGTDWEAGHSSTNCYLLLPNGLSAKDFEKQLVPFYKKYHEKKNGYDRRYFLQPLSELHSGLCNNYSNRQVPEKSLWILGIIGLFLIVIASINFINLSVVQATKRFKEIGIKKIFGEGKSKSIFQFLIESIFITYIAAFIGLFIAQFILIYLEGIIGYRLNLDLLTNPDTIIYLILLATTIGLLSGLYPSMIIAGMSANVALKSSLTRKNSSVSLSLRRALVIIQFTISLVLIIGTLVMNRQLNYFLNKDLGFDKEAILLVTLPEANKDKLPLLKEKLLTYPEIEMVSLGTRSPLADWRVSNIINHPSIEKDTYTANLKSVDEDYLDLYKLRIIAGQNFSNVKNTGDIVVNRKLTKLLGFNNPVEALGERIKYTANEFKIVGVVEDFHARSLQRAMENVIFGNFNGLINEMAIKMNPTVLSLNGYQQILKKVQTEWDGVFSNDIMNYNFFDDKIASLYKEEKNTSNLIQLFALIAILIGSLGLYGLISYIISQKTKEISIRKVNGAKVSEILVLLNKDFMIYFGIAFVIACPIAYITMDKWLQNFAFKTDLSWWLFALAGFAALVISLTTVSGQTFKAARRNPVEAFRYE